MIRDDRPHPESWALADTAHRPGPARGPTVALHSFGCKLNQCETAGIRARFVGAGFTAVAVSDSGSGPPASGSGRHVSGSGRHVSGSGLHVSASEPPAAPRLVLADVHVINTCSVTGRADAQARQLVRKLIRQQPAARVIVTGCYAQRAPDEIARIPGVFLVAGNAEKDRLHELVGGMLEAPPLDGESLATRVAVSDLRKVQRSFDLEPVDFGERTRAFLRVQDGCDAGCTFCIIPRIRGRSTSLSINQAVQRARDLIASEYKEIILTGIHLGMYGLDRHDGREDAGGLEARDGHDTASALPARDAVSLAGLVDAIHELGGECRLRLSSIEPQEIDDALIDRIADGRLAPHLHVPLQSGCDRILAAMNRTYRADEYDKVLGRLTSRIDPIGLGADVIVGFPGETDAEFEATYRFIAARPFTYLHVFPFSARPGTRAGTLPGRLPGPVLEERSARLRVLSDLKREQFAARFIGRTVRVLVEHPKDTSAWDGWSDHYVRIRFDWPTGEDLTNRFLAVRGHRIRAGALEGDTCIDASRSAR